MIFYCLNILTFKPLISPKHLVWAPSLTILAFSCCYRCIKHTFLEILNLQAQIIQRYALSLPCTAVGIQLPLREIRRPCCKALRHKKGTPPLRGLRYQVGGQWKLPVLQELFVENPFIFLHHIFACWTWLGEHIIVQFQQIYLGIHVHPQPFRR